MFFIYGWGHRQKPIANGEFSCPVCRTRTNYTHYSQRRWFSFFFVPIFPLTTPQEFVGCHQCQNIFSLDSLPASYGIRHSGVSVSGLALASMLISFLALLSVCVFFVSLPLSLAAVVMGHLGYHTVRKNRPYLDGGWQAVTGLCVGYLAMVLSIAIGAFIMFGPDLTPKPDDGGVASFAERSKGIHEGGSKFSAKRALDNAESKITAKQNLPAGRGNSPEAIELANLFADKLKSISDEAFTSGRKPILQLSRGEYLTFCELHEDRCLFLVHVPSYRNFTSDARKTLAELAWATAQLSVADVLPPGTQLGVGLRGTLLYGDIMLGSSPTSSEDLTPSRRGEESDLLSFFIEDIPVESVASESNVAKDAVPTEKPAIDDADPFASEGDTPETDTASMAKEDATTSSNENTAESPDNDVPLQPAPTVNSEPEFENKIPLNLHVTIENKSWAFNSLAFSHNGKWLAAGKLDGTVWIFDVATGNVVTELERVDKAQQISSIAFTHEDKYLVAGGGTGLLSSWSVSASGQLADLEQFQPAVEGELQSLLASPSYDYLAMGDRKGKIVWCPIRDAKDKSRELSAFSQKVQAMWLPAKGVEAYATDGESLCRFSLKNGEVVDKRKLNIKYPQLSRFSNDGTMLYITDFNDLHVLETGSSEQGGRSFTVPMKESVHALALHPNQKWLATGLRKRTAIWDLESREVLAYVASKEIFNDDYVVFSEDGKWLAIATNSTLQPIRIYEVGEMQP